MTRKSDANEPTFEQAIEDLEGIIDRIESGQIGLEECLAHYERGMKLVQRCQTILTAAQTRMAQVKVDFDGKLREEAGPGDDELDAQPDDDEVADDPHDDESQ
jgi:exodeoxyribonuclease VII small subunit